MIGFSRYKFWESITRKYYDADGKLVATNRHKAMEQKSDSLAEYRATYGEQNVCQLTVKAHSPAYKDMLGVTPGSLLTDNNGNTFTLLRSDGKYNGLADCFAGTQGEKHLVKKSGTYIAKIR